LHARQALLADAGAIFISMVLNGVLGFLYWAIAARLYPSEAVGLASAAVSAMFLIGNLSRLGLDVTLVHNLPLLPSAEQRRRIVASSLILTTVLGTFVGFIFVMQPFAAAETSDWLRGNGWLTIMFAVACGIWSMGLVLEPVLLVDENGDYVVRKNLSFSLVRLVMLIVLLPVVGHELGVFTSTSAGVIAGIVVLIGLVPRSSTVFPLSVRRWLLDVRSVLGGYALGNYFSALVGGLPNWILPLIVAEKSGPDAAAYFYITWMIVTVLNTVASSLAQSLFTQGSQQGTASRELVLRAYGYGVIAIVAGAVGLLVAGDWILRIMGSAYAEAGGSLLRVLAVASVPYTIVQLYVSQLRLAGRLKVLNLVVAVLAGIALPGSYVLLERRQLAGVGIAWLVACVASMAICMADAWKYRHARLSES
jgi:O-antigen/teichoic acid export membrane protein